MCSLDMYKIERERECMRRDPYNSRWEKKSQNSG